MAQDKQDNKKQELNEPHVPYGALRDKKIRIFHSFEEQEDEMIEYWASISPMQRLANLRKMILISYGLTDEKLSLHKRAKTIQIINSES
jgi:hypothetical protein